MTAQEKYNLYLKKYCTSRKVSSEEAERHRLVQETKKYYEMEEENDEQINSKSALGFNPLEG